MTYSQYKSKSINSDDLKVFFAFDNKQLQEGVQQLNEKHSTNITAKDLYKAYGGMLGTKEDIQEFYKRIREFNNKIPELFSAQEVYNHEFANLECDYTGDDEEAIKIVVELFGIKATVRVKRKYANTLLE